MQALSLLLLMTSVSLISSTQLPNWPVSSSESSPKAFKEFGVTTSIASNLSPTTPATTTVLAYTTKPVLPTSPVSTPASTALPVVTTTQVVSTSTPVVTFKEFDVTTPIASNLSPTTPATTTVLAYTTTPVSTPAYTAVPVVTTTQVVSTSTPVVTSVPIYQASTTLSTVITMETSTDSSIATPTTMTPITSSTLSATAAEPYDMYEYQYEAANEENADDLENVEDELEPDSSFIFPQRFKFLEDQIKHKMDDLKQIEESKIEKIDTKDDDAALMEDFVVIPPRFKYMEKTIKGIQEDLKQGEPHAEEQTEFKNEIWTADILNTMENLKQEEVMKENMDTNDDDADLVKDFPVVPPRFKYMEKQIKENKQQMSFTVEEQTERNDETITEIPLPPRFKYMEKKIKQDKEGLEEVEEEIQNDANVAIESTTAGQMSSIAEDQTERNDQTTTTQIPLPPRFKYMEKQIKQDKEELEDVEEAQNDATAATEFTTAGHFPVQIVVEDDDVVAKEGLEMFDIREDNLGQGSVQKKVYNKEERQLALKNMEEEEEENAPQPPVVLNLIEELKKSNGWFSWLPFW